MKVVTALRQAGRQRVAVELDGAPWRVLPLEAVLAAGIDTGSTLDRSRARRLRAELRRVEARSAALSALARRDHTAATLRHRLDARGIAPAARDETLAALERSGLVDDVRVAHGRAAALAERAAGDAMIRCDLEQRGVAASVIEEAIAGLEPELDRARRALGPDGPSQRALRRLAARGFAHDVLEALIADPGGSELGYESFT